MALPNTRPDGTLPPGQHFATSFDEIRAGFPAKTARRQTLESALELLIEAVRQFSFGHELVIDGSYTTGKRDPSDIDLVLLSNGMSEADMLRQLTVVGIDLNLLDLFVVTARPSFERWVQFFSFDRNQRARGVVILTI